MKEHDSRKLQSFENPDIKHLQLFLYLIPIFGFFPALWTLYRRQGSREQQTLSRLAVTLALCWLLSYILLGTGAQLSEGLALPLLLTNSILTSSYFIINIWLMVRLWQRRPPQLPLISRVSKRLWRKYLS